MFGLRPMELLLILGILILLFGATRLPALGSSLGSAIRNFKKGFGGADDESEAPKGGPTSLSSGSGTEKDVHAKSSTRQG